MKRLCLYIAPVLALILSACESQTETPSPEGAGLAEGEVLGGTISDEMIPLEQLRSQAPLAPREVTASGPRSTVSSEPENDEAGAADAAPAPETPAE